MSVERAAEILASAAQGVALTGAGISAESGIPTFRGEGGLWTQYDPVKVATIERFREDPRAYWTVARERGPAVLSAEPNPGHLALAGLEQSGHLVAVVTQNTDGLHQDAGSNRVIELHGSGRTVQCLDCGTRESRRDVQGRLIRRLAVAGRQLIWDGRGEHGEMVPNGAYFATLEAGGRSTTIRLSLVH